MNRSGRQLGRHEPGWPDHDGRRTRRWAARAQEVPSSGLDALVVVFALLAVAAWFVYSSFLKPAPDYEGDGTGTVIIKVESGQSIPAIGNTLASKDVVKSADAFVDAASDDPKARTIQAGVYKMKSQMSAQAALNVLTNPSNKAGVVIVTEGMRANKVAQVAADATGVPLAEFEKVIANPSNVGLPTWGNNHIEGFLYPATYDFEPGTSATAVFKTMVAKFKEYAASINLERQAAASGQSPYDVLKIASILEAESQPADYAKVARVIDNRIACTLPACKNGTSKDACRWTQRSTTRRTPRTSISARLSCLLTARTTRTRTRVCRPRPLAIQVLQRLRQH